MTDRLRRLSASLALGAAVLLLPACEGAGEKATTQPATQAAAGSDTVAMGILNDTCPISGEAVDPNARTVEYAGHKIGFCCNMCPGQWDEMTDARRRSFVANYAR